MARDIISSRDNNLSLALVLENNRSCVSVGGFSFRIGGTLLMPKDIPGLCLIGNNIGRIICAHTV